MSAIVDVIVERARQITKEQFTVEHDDRGNNEGQLACAAACYALWEAFPRPWHRMRTRVKSACRELWPWSSRWWKPRTHRENLVRAAALIVAEIERLDRKEAKKGDTDA